ncbi:MAG: hypothetical protein GY696_37685 [Gammaproteobacteria bacterium]|nr:hypothetical protein [Gammaproteobacteria bacterium]
MDRSGDLQDVPRDIEVLIMDWMKIGSAVLIGMMILFLLPRAKQMLTQSPEAKPGDWQGVILPILAVAGFVVLLIALV